MSFTHKIQCLFWTSFKPMTDHLLLEAVDGNRIAYN